MLNLHFIKNAAGGWPSGVSECPERKERRKRNGHSKPCLGPRVQRRENVGGSLNP